MQLRVYISRVPMQIIVNQSQAPCSASLRLLAQLLSELSNQFFFGQSVLFHLLVIEDTAFLTSDVLLLL